MKYAKEPSWKKNRKITSALIVGAGAVENAWYPIMRALQPFIPNLLKEDTANCYLARIVYILRYYSTSTVDVKESLLEEAKKSLKEIREAICRELKKSQQTNEIKI